MFSKKEIKNFIEQTKFCPQKKLGQNFLVDNNIANNIVKNALSEKPSLILEIGPGFGEITEGLVSSGVDVFACEYDRMLCDFLEDKFRDVKTFRLIRSNVLKFDFSECLLGMWQNKMLVVGNLPYYITSPILERVIEYRNIISKACFMMQKEVAERINASVGTDEYSSLSCYINYYCSVKKLFPVSKNCFYPAPDVDSCYVMFDFGFERKNKADNEESLFKIIRAGFNKRRKKFVNSVYESLGIEKNKLMDILTQKGISVDIRAEKLSLDDFIQISNELGR